MLRENNYILRQVNIAADFALSIAAFFAAHVVRYYGHQYYPRYISPAPWEHYAWILAFLPFLTVLVLGYNGFYKSHRFRMGVRDLIWRIGVSCLEIMILLIGAIYVSWRGDIIPYIGSPDSGSLKVEDLVSRALLALIAVALFLFLSIKTYTIRRILTYLRSKGYNYRRVVLVGSGEPLGRFIRHMESHPIWGLRIEAIITDRDGEFDPNRIGEPAQLFGYPIMGDLEHGESVVTDHQVDEVVFVPDAVPPSRLAPLQRICEEMGIRTHLPLHFFAAEIARPTIDYFDDMPVISYWPTREIGPALLFKYAFDRIFGLILLILFAIPMLIITLAIKLTSKKGEPIFFSQIRSGINGRRFKFYKFRTMHVGADAMLEELKAHNEADGPVFKMKRDPRVTPLGRFLRKFSLDELPQLWNVVKGEMSLVGPRPPLPHEVRKYDRWQRRRLSMKPGITCLWQVSGRHQLSFDTWMNLDLQYIDNWSLTLDFKILLRTIYAVISGQGAM